MNETLSFSAAQEKKRAKQAWNVFFAHLASAQAAAADECHSLALDLELEGRFDLADHYRVFESEERAHASTMRSLCTEWVEPNRRTKRLLKAKLVGKAGDSLEKMAILHFSIDTSFLTFLGALHRNAPDLISDAAWAGQIQTRLAPIVRDEVFHLNEGQEMTIELARGRSQESRQGLKRRLSIHQRLVARAFSRMFSGTNVPASWLAEMNENSRHRFERSVDSILN